MQGLISELSNYSYEKEEFKIRFYAHEHPFEDTEY